MFIIFDAEKYRVNRTNKRTNLHVPDIKLQCFTLATNC